MARSPGNVVRLDAPSRGMDGRSVLAGARAPLLTDGRVGDHWIDQVGKRLYGPKTASGWPDLGLIKGDRGWVPVLAYVTDGLRRVAKIVDWSGGEGAKPVTGKYIGPLGLVDAIGDAVDMRGPQGPAMLVSALTAGTDDVTYETVLAVADPGGDNERQPLKHLLAAGGIMPFATLAAAQAASVPARVKALTIVDATEAQGGAYHHRRRVAAEPLTGPKHRSADRFLPDGNTDNANGGWWALDASALISLLKTIKAVLPTTPPTGAGEPWLNSGSINFTPEA